MNSIDVFEACGSHYDVGFAIGSRFADAIHRFFDNYDLLQQHLLPFYKTSTGKNTYQPYLALHRTRFPGYLSELEGIAAGADRPFEEIFLANLRGEFSGLIPPGPRAGDILEIGGRQCTDCLVFSADTALIGHNEDGSPASLGGMFVVKVSLEDQPAFSALCYPGFLPGNAFGFNEAGMLHTINHVAPRPVAVGISRHFLARSLLDARSLEEAIHNITVSGRAAGFNYNIGSISERRMVSVEVAPQSHHVHKVRGHYVHTNHYFQLNEQKQETSPSSRVRLDRARALCHKEPPAAADHVLAVLGDQTDRDYPIYRDATLPDNSATLCSALFDLDKREVRIYWDNPAKEPDKYVKFAL
jgi:hypothetical protein